MRKVINILIKLKYNYVKVYFYFNFLVYYVFGNIYWYYYLCVLMNKISMSDYYIKEKEKFLLNIFFKELIMIENNYVY